MTNGTSSSDHSRISNNQLYLFHSEFGVFFFRVSHLIHKDGEILERAGSPQGVAFSLDISSFVIKLITKALEFEVG
jgi:hypothetical protein